MKNTPVKKPPVKKTVRRKRPAKSEGTKKAQKRQKTTENPSDGHPTFREESKDHLKESQNIKKEPAAKQTKKKARPSPRKGKLQERRRNKEINAKSKTDTKILSAFEVAKMIEASNLTPKKILESIDAPKENYLTVFDNIKDISLSLVKKIEASIHKSRIQRRKLKDMFVKTLKNQKTHSEVMSSRPPKLIIKVILMGIDFCVFGFWG